MCESENETFKVREGYRLKLSGNKVLRRIFKFKERNVMRLLGKTA